MKAMRYFLLLALGLLEPAWANPFQGVVLFNYDYQLDGALHARRHYKLELSGDEQQLQGHYTDLDNDSSWLFKFYSSRGTTVINALQLDGSFYRVMSGEVQDNKIVGSWFAVGGLKGDFEIIKP